MSLLGFEKKNVNVWFDGFHYNAKFYYTAVIGNISMIIKNNVDEYTRNRGELKAIIDLIRRISDSYIITNLFIASINLYRALTADLQRIINNANDRTVSNKMYIIQCINNNIGSINITPIVNTNPHNVNRIILQLHVNRNNMLRNIGDDWILESIKNQPTILFD